MCALRSFDLANPTVAASLRVKSTSPLAEPYEAFPPSGYRPAPWTSSSSGAAVAVVIAVVAVVIAERREG